MKKLVIGAAFLFALTATHAAPRPNRNNLHNIVSTELPAALRSGIHTTYAVYWITDLKKEGVGRHAKYFLTIESPDEVLHLQADKKGAWVVVSTEAKPG